MRGEYYQQKAILEAVQTELDLLSVHSDERELVISDYTRKVSLVQGEIDRLTKVFPLVDELDSLKGDISRIAGEIRQLEIDIEDLQRRSHTRRQFVLGSIAEKTQLFLEAGAGNEEDFINASQKEVEIDFEKDRWLLGGRISFSESSNAEKKSALHFSLLLHALTDPECRYPRFSIMDFECADLNEERSQKIQSNILNALKGTSDFQLLITSSKIASELNTNEYGVGPYYGKNDYIFKIPTVGSQKMPSEE